MYYFSKLYSFSVLFLQTGAHSPLQSKELKHSQNKLVHMPTNSTQTHACSVYTIQATTCIGACVFSCNLPLHFWQNGQDLLHATAVTWGWIGYWNKIQHRKLTQEKKSLPLLRQGLKPKTFLSRVHKSTTELSLLPSTLDKYIFIPR